MDVGLERRDVVRGELGTALDLHLGLVVLLRYSIPHGTRGRQVGLREGLKLQPENKAVSLEVLQLMVLQDLN